MGSKQVFTGFFLLVLATTSPFSQAADPADRSIEDISACMRVNVFDRDSLRDFQIRAVDREGKSTSVKTRVFWKPGKNDDNIRITLQVAEPETLAGTAYLLVRNGD